MNRRALPRVPPGMRLLLVVPVLLLAAACGSGEPDVAAPSPVPTPVPSADGGDLAAGGGISQAENDLAVAYDAGDGSAPVTWTLTCVGSVDGDHPDAEAACAHLHGVEDPFAPLPEDRVCTEQYGGPQTARITGLWRGQPVDLEVSRTDGCRISQWQSLGPLLPQDVGAEPPADQPQ